jgi:uncharacterized membrane protein YbhN (UPF0104 family)
VFAAIGFEVVSQASAIVVQHHLLRRAGSSIELSATSRLVLAQNAVGLAVPGGPAVTSVFSYRQIRRRGTNPSAGAWIVAATSGAGMLALATFGAITATGASWLSVVVGAALIASLAVLVVMIRSPQRLARPATMIVLATDRLRRRVPDRTAATRRVQLNGSKAGQSFLASAP